MQRQKQGHIINIASVLGFKVLAPGGTVYSATKFAVRAITEGLRIELKADNIRTTMISPGVVATELPEGSSDEATRQYLRDFYKIAFRSSRSHRRSLTRSSSRPQWISTRS